MDPGIRRISSVAAAVIAWGAGLAALVAGARAVCPSAGCPVPAWDRRLLTLADGMRTPALDTCFRASTWLGSIYVLLPLALLVAALCWWRGRRHAAVFLVVALAGARLLALLCKRIADRPRPDLFAAVVPLPGSAAFPSAHAVQITAFALACAILAGARHRALTIPLAALAILAVGFSRIYLQVHFPSDVLAGWLIGACWVAGLCLAWGRRIMGSS